MTALSTAEISRQIPEIFAHSVINCFIVDGDRIEDKPSFLKEFSDVLHFPGYFGFNWDAFQDCITDLAWLDSENGFLIIYKNPHRFKLSHPDDWNVANEILLDAVDYWRRQGKSMMIVFS